MRTSVTSHSLLLLLFLVACHLPSELFHYDDVHDITVEHCKGAETSSSLFCV